MLHPLQCPRTYQRKLSPDRGEPENVLRRIELHQPPGKVSGPASSLSTHVNQRVGGIPCLTTTTTVVSRVPAGLKTVEGLTTEEWDCRRRPPTREVLGGAWCGEARAVPCVSSNLGVTNVCTTWCAQAAELPALFFLRHNTRINSKTQDDGFGPGNRERGGQGYQLCDLTSDDHSKCSSGIEDASLSVQREGQSRRNRRNQPKRKLAPTAGSSLDYSSGWLARFPPKTSHVDIYAQNPFCDPKAMADIFF